VVGFDRALLTKREIKQIPYSLLAVTFIAKVLAFVNERDDPFAVGDEFGLVIPLALMVIVTTVILYRTRRTSELPETTARLDAPRVGG
jgi:hypothetical protein